MKLDWNARKDFVRDLWRMFVLYAYRVDVQFHERVVVITVHCKEKVEVDEVKYLVISDWNRYVEVPTNPTAESVTVVAPPEETAETST